MSSQRAGGAAERGRGGAGSRLGSQRLHPKRPFLSRCPARARVSPGSGGAPHRTAPSLPAHLLPAASCDFPEGENALPLYSRPALGTATPSAPGCRLSRGATRPRKPPAPGPRARSATSPPSGCLATLQTVTGRPAHTALR